MSAATDALEEVNEAFILEELQRRAREEENKESAAIKALAKEIRNFAETVAEASVKRAGVEDAPVPPVAPSPELPEVLREMKQFNSRVLSLMDRPIPASGLSVIPAPNVTVAAPSVSVTPSIVLERNNTRYRVTVTKRDMTAQQRIQELIIEPIE